MRRLFGESRGVAWGAMFVIALVALLLVRPVAMSVFSWHRTAGLLSERRAEVDRLQRTHDGLQAKLAYYETDQFIAEQARTYGMLAPGERVYVIRELARPEAAAQFAISRLRNATVDHELAPPVS